MYGTADLSDFFRSWKYDSDNQVRIIKADDGRDVLQIRQPLGVEQYELDGRPDGQTPEGHSSWLELFQERLERHIEENGSEAGFALSHDDFLLLQNEGLLNYYRYLVLFQIGDFERTARDTGQNLALCELVRSTRRATRTRRTSCNTGPTSCACTPSPRPWFPCTGS